MSGLAFGLVLTVHLIAAAALIVLVLLQRGKGADAGAAFGGGTSASLFGAAVFATIFFLTSLGLTYLANRAHQAPSSVMQEPAAAVPKGPAVPE